MTGINESF
jgi:hypothetical protein